MPVPKHICIKKSENISERVVAIPRFIASKKCFSQRQLKGYFSVS